MIEDLDILIAANIENNYNKETINKIYQSIKSKKSFVFYAFNTLTLGFYSFLLKKTIRTKTKEKLSKRKIEALPQLLKTIQSLKEVTTSTSPTDGIKKIYAKLISDPAADRFSIYSKSEILLIISCPFDIKELEDTISAVDSRLKWSQLKKQLRVIELESIKQINQTYEILKNRYLLTKSDVNQRLYRTQIAAKTSGHLISLLSVEKAFSELKLSFEAYSHLKKTHHKQYQFLSFIININETELDELTAYIEKRISFDELSQSTKRYLFEISLKKLSMPKVERDDFLSKFRLITNPDQEKILTLILDAEFKETEEISHCLSTFLDSVKMGISLQSASKSETCFIDETAEPTAQEDFEENAFVKYFSADDQKTNLSNQLKTLLSENFGKSSFFEDLKVTEVDVHSLSDQSPCLRYRYGNDNVSQTIDFKLIKKEGRWNLSPL